METLQKLLRTRDRKRDRSLAERTGIAPERLKELEKGAGPDLEELRGLSDFFHVELRDLLPLHPRHRFFALLFRSGGTDIDEITCSALSRRMGYSIDLLGARQAALPGWAKEFNLEGRGYEDAEANSVIFRRLFVGNDQVSPLFGLADVAVDRLGIFVFVLRTSGFEGASACVEGFPFAFLAETFPPRMLFTLAHEIGHLIAHHDPARGFGIVDVQTEHRPQPKRNTIEFYAHAFASCLLMPKDGVAVALRKIRELGRDPNRELGDLEILLLARIYGVSFYAAARRCEDLGLLPRGGAASLEETLRKEYGSPEKRAEAADLPPRPQPHFPRVPARLLQAALEQVRSGRISIGKASSILGLSIADILTANSPSAT